MFIFHVEAPTPQALAETVIDRLVAAGWVVEKVIPGEVNPFPPIDYEPPAVPVQPPATAAGPEKPPRKTRASKPKEDAAAPADPPTPPAASATETAGGAPTPSSAPASATLAAATDPDELRTKIRAVLTPLMNPESGKADRARALIKKFGANITTAAVDSLPVFLAEAEELAK